MRPAEILLFVFPVRRFRRRIFRAHILLKKFDLAIISSGFAGLFALEHYGQRANDPLTPRFPGTARYFYQVQYNHSVTVNCDKMPHRAMVHRDILPHPHRAHDS
jgi:hypothetical protein